MKNTVIASLVAPALALAACSQATPPPAATAAAPPPEAPAASAAPAPTAESSVFVLGGAAQLVIPFAQGGAKLTPEAEAQLDLAARTYRDGHPLMMYVAGFTDRPGSELTNLVMAARRAAAVKAGLVARGIPADRLETASLGESDPAIQTPQGVPEPANRRVVVTWK